MINVKLTVGKILATPDCQFSVLSDEKGTVTLATNVNNNFQRAIISVNEESIAVGLQGPNDQGVIGLSFQPIGVDILQSVTYQQAPDLTTSDKPDAKAKK